MEDSIAINRYVVVDLGISWKMAESASVIRTTDNTGGNRRNNGDIFKWVKNMFRKPKSGISEVSRYLNRKIKWSASEALFLK